MDYEKKKCPTCGTVTTNIERLLHEAEKTLPADFELYDFGGGCCVVPAPDPAPGGSYLTSHIIAVCNKEKRTVTGVKFDYATLSSAKLAELLEVAIQRNTEQTKQFELAA